MKLRFRDLLPEKQIEIECAACLQKTHIKNLIDNVYVCPECFAKAKDDWDKFPSKRKDLLKFFKKDEIEKRREEIPKKHLKEKVIKILKEGDPLLHLLKTVKIIHVGDDHVILLLILSGFSSGFKDRKKTIHVLVVGRLSKGKSSTQDHVEVIFNNIETVTSSSAKSQFYKAKAGLLPDNGIIRFDEAEGSHEAIVLERSLTDDTINEPKHDTITDKKEFVQLVIKEINAVWKNRVDTPEDNQLNSRYLICNVDESSEQDDAVDIKTLEEFSFDDFIKKEREEFILAKLITDEIKVESVRILIPYGPLIENKQKENRRTTKKFMRLLSAIVYCYRFQRPIIDGYVIATRKDFEIAQLLWDRITAHESTQLSQKHLSVLYLLSSEESDAIDRKSLAENLKVSIDTANNYLKKLIDAGYVNYKENLENTRKYLYWRTKGFEGLRITLDWDKFTLESLYEFFIKKTKKKKEELEKMINFEELHNKITTTCISAEFLALLKTKEEEPKEGNKPKKPILVIPLTPSESFTLTDKDKELMF